MQISGQLVDLHTRRIYGANLFIEKGFIKNISQSDHSGGPFILPGFIDAHVHIESSMLVPTAFSKLATRFGTVATVSDPHEIANVLGVPGIDYMIENAGQAAVKFFFGVPSCVPATNFETAGAIIDAMEIKQLLKRPDIWYLAEMMNYPGVIHNDPAVCEKLKAAKSLGLRIDGHAPGVSGPDAIKYFDAGITTDHECVSLHEALEKIRLGVRILIRDGSAAKNYDALHSLITSHPARVMFCSDDKHPDDLIQGHINDLVVRALADGHELFDVLRVACLNPIKHYGLPVGTLRVGEPADFILVEDLTDFKVISTYINGVPVMQNGISLESDVAPDLINNFHVATIEKSRLVINGDAEMVYPIIEAHDSQLITSRVEIIMRPSHGQLLADPTQDILKIVVINRYTSHPNIGLAFIKGFGLRQGAIASSVAHDSHNIVAIGTDDEHLCHIINRIIETGGGIGAVNRGETHVLPLPIGGIMSELSGEEVAEHYSFLDRFVKEELGSSLTAPFMTLSFMALLVIPSLKISDQGLFDVDQFKLVYANAKK